MRRNLRITLGLCLLGMLLLITLMAPLIAGDPLAFRTVNRLRPPSAEFWFGTDNYGHSVFDRTVYGGRISLLVGAAVALISITLGLAIGLIAGYYQHSTASSCASWTVSWRSPRSCWQSLWCR